MRFKGGIYIFFFLQSDKIPVFLKSVAYFTYVQQLPFVL